MTEEQSNITRIELDGKEYILIGTAHVSKSSAEEVKAVIETELPDSVCIELDKQRYENIMDENKWKDTDIFKVIKEKKTTLLLINLAISSFRSEEHTSELQSRGHLVCRLLLEKKIIYI